MFDFFFFFPSKMGKAHGMREDYRMVEVEGDLRCASEILVWQHCILWMGLGNRERCKDSGDRKLSQRLNYPGRNKILAWSTGRVH